MSTAAKRVCDGCGAEADPSVLYPSGWMRLLVKGRPRAADGMRAMGAVDICRIECAELALKPALERIL